MAKDTGNSGGPGTGAEAWALTRRAALGVLGAGALGAVLWPRTPRSEMGVPRGRTLLTYWEKWNGLERAAVQEAVDAFNASQERSFVRYVPVPETGPKAMVAIGAGDAPDVVGLYSYHIPLFAESLAAMPLNEFADFGKRIDAGAYVPAVAKLLTYGGKQWAGVNTYYTMALFRNRALFREAGLDPDKPPATLDELSELAVHPKLLKRERGAIVQGAFLPNMPSVWPYFWPTMFGCPLYDAGSDRAIIADAAGVASYEWVKGLGERIGAAAGSLFANGYNEAWYNAGNPFFSGKLAMMVHGPWMTNFIKNLAPGLEYAVSPMPLTPTNADREHPAGMVEADVLVIPRGCPHPEEAFEFVCFMQRADVQERLALLHGKPSPMRAVSAEFVKRQNTGIDVFDAIAKSPAVQILPQTRVWKAYSEELVGTFDKAWGGGDVKAELTRVERRAQELIDRAAAARRQRGEQRGGMSGRERGA